jgi:hypothetical protein
MKTTALLLILGLSVLATGCGPSKAEREAAERERARLELERKIEEEKRIANEAFRDVGKKLGRKPPALDLGVPAEPASQAPADTPAPAEQSKEQ